MLLNLARVRRCAVAVLLTILPIAANAITGKLYEYDKLTNSLVTQLCQDKYGYVWIATDFGLNKFDGYHFVNYYYSSRDSLSIPHNLVRSLLCTKDGEMFIGTGKGLARYDYTTDKFHRFRFPGDIQPRVNSLVEMSSGNLLVCTAGYGVYVLNRRDMKLSEEKSYSNLAANNYLSGFYVEDAGTVWCFTRDRRIVRFVVNGDKAVSFRSHQPKGAIPSSIVKDSNGKPLFVMNNALMRYDNKNGRFVDAGYGYWVGTWQSLYLYDPISDKSVLFHDLDHKGSPFIAEDKFGNIYISIFGEGFAVGLRYYNSRTTAKDKVKFTNDWVGQMYCDHEGMMWITSSSGTWCFNPKTMKFVDLGGGDGILKDKSCTALTETTHHNIINVGDLKPKEVPINFIMDYAWNPDAIQPGDEKAWLEGFTRSVFGEEYAAETADIIAKYSKYNLWRKAEAQYPGIFNNEEMLKTNAMWQSLVVRCENLKAKLPKEMQDAFYQLVYYPAVGSAGVAQIYNYSTMGDSLAIEALMDKDRRLTEHYNTGIANGKWNGMMLDNHIGYTKWSIPDKNYNPMTLGFKVEHDLSPKETSEYSIPAYKYNNKVDGKDAKWIFLPDLGRGEGCMGSDNVVAASDITGNGAALEYDIDLKTDMVAIGILPTQDIRPEPGLRLGVQIDNQPMKIIDARQGIVDTFGEYTSKNLAVSKVLKPLPAPNRLLLSGWYKGKRLPRRDEVFDNNHYSYFGAKEKK